MINLTLYPPENSAAFYIFNFPIHFYGIVVSIAILVGIFGAYFLIKNKYSKDYATLFLDYSPMVIICAIIGARLFYVIGDLGFYLQNPTEIIMINHGGLSIWGGIAFGIIALYFYTRKHELSFRENLDIFALFMPFCQAIGRWGNFFNQEAYGKPCDGFIKYYIDPHHRYTEFQDIKFYHPTFLYEMIVNLILFCVLFWIYKNKNLKKGTITCLYLIFYGIIRILIEQIRIDSVCYLFNIPIAVVISLVAIIIASIALYQNQKS